MFVNYRDKRGESGRQKFFDIYHIGIMCCKQTNLILLYHILFPFYLQEYEDVFPKELPSGLITPSLGNWTPIDFMLSLQLPNKSWLIEVIWRTPNSYKGKLRNSLQGQCERKYEFVHHLGSLGSKESCNMAYVC